MAARKSQRPPLADYADKEITDQYAGRAGWLTDQTGYDVDAMSVQLAVGLDKEWRESDTYQKLRNERVASRAREKAEARQRIIDRERDRVERLRKAAEEAQARFEAKVGAPSDTETPAEPEKAAPRKAPAKKAPAKKAAAKKAPAKKLAAVPDPAPEPEAAPSSAPSSVVVDDDF